MRRPLALLALVVTTWSNAAALQCAVSAAPTGHAEAAAEKMAHSGHTHAPVSQEPERASEHGHGGPTSHPGTPDCGAIMACGAALGATMAHGDHAEPDGLERFGAGPADSPSTADLSQDPPPPRRHA